ncbi:MAG: Uma2 family endonuclease [Pirellulaceae bacterium]|nr:Uma2 family endonuclease [Pirellulaceae bacterium]
MASGVVLKARPIEYPEDDGEPLSDNTLQFRWIMTIQGGLDALFAQNPQVFVAGNLLWYPLEGDNVTRRALDAMVVFARPKGERGSYRQWDEAGIGPQVVFEVLSPGNRPGELVRQFRFYERFGVEEYYIYDPDQRLLVGYARRGAVLEEIENTAGWVSPRLGIRFELSSGELQIFRPDGRMVATYLELAEENQLAHERADLERQRADKEQKLAEQERRRAEKQRARAEQEQKRAESLAEKLRQHGIDPDA